MSRAIHLLERLPRGAIRPEALLPLLRELTDALVTLAAARSGSEGRPISCRAGCAACCRQLVPVGPAEATALRDEVARMSAGQRARMKARLEEAQRTMRDVGLERLRSPSTMTEGERLRDASGDYLRVALAYAARWIDCPFLEDERCTIYGARPIACRQYLAISPAENCRHVDRPGVEALPLAQMVFEALAAIDGPEWVPLPYALEWSEGSSRTPALESAGALLDRGLRAL